jgi:hypothetical protein
VTDFDPKRAIPNPNPRKGKDKEEQRTIVGERDLPGSLTTVTTAIVQDAKIPHRRLAGAWPRHRARDRQQGTVARLLDGDALTRKGNAHVGKRLCGSTTITSSGRHGWSLPLLTHSAASRVKLRSGVRKEEEQRE